MHWNHFEAYEALYEPLNHSFASIKLEILRTLDLNTLFLKCCPNNIYTISL